jgi:hypothetical protein
VRRLARSRRRHSVADALSLPQNRTLEETAALFDGEDAVEELAYEAGAEARRVESPSSGEKGKMETSHYEHQRI